MNLEKLIQSREEVSESTFPIPDKELLARFEQLYTGAVNDVLREFCLLDQALPGHILPLREYRTVAGFAFTVKSAPNVKISGEMAYRTQMLAELKEDAFAVCGSSSGQAPSSRTGNDRRPVALKACAATSASPAVR